MKTLHLYLTRQILGSLLMTVAVFTFVLLLGNVLKEILTLLVSRQISLSAVFKAIGLLIPYVMAYVLPFGMLTSTLLVFGRFSADQELTAARASGLSLLSLVTPILLLALFMSASCALFNMWIAPACRGAYKDLVYNMAMQSSATLITEDRFIDEIPGMVLYVRQRNGDYLKDIRIYKLENNEIITRTSATTGRLKWEKAGLQMTIELTNCLYETKVKTNPEEQEKFIGPPTARPPAEWIVTRVGSAESDPIDLSELMKGERKPRLSEMNFFQLFQEISDRKRQGIPATPALVQLHRQASFSFACFGFTLIGIPLAIRAHRRETSIGIAIALGLLLVYYSFFILGEALEARESLKPYLILWIPNFLFQILGAWLLWRANRRI